MIIHFAKLMKIVSLSSEALLKDQEPMNVSKARKLAMKFNGFKKEQIVLKLLASEPVIAQCAMKVNCTFSEVKMTITTNCVTFGN